MRRRVFNILAVSSLLMCAAAVWLWVRSCSTGDHFVRRGPENDRRVTTSFGYVMFTREALARQHDSEADDDAEMGWKLERQARVERIRLDPAGAAATI